MAKTIDLYLDKGTEFVAIFPPVTTSDGSVVNLTGYTVTSLMRRSYATRYAVQITAAITNASAGIIKLSLTNVETSGLAVARWVYDVMIENNTTHEITKVFDGILTVNPSTSGQLNTILLTPGASDDYGGI